MSSPLGLGLACVGSTAFQGRNGLRPRACADQWLGRPGGSAGRSLACVWPAGTIGQVVKAIGRGGTGGRGVRAQSLQAPTLLTSVTHSNAA